jgi:hypothetical protein
MSVRLVAAVFAGCVILATGGVAQDLDGPVNLPPPGFEGQQFVDNAGCAFARAGVSGNTVWVPRVNQSRDQICGLAPSFGATAVADAPTAPPRSPILNPGAPIPTVASTVPATAPVPVIAPAPAPAAVPVAAPTPAPAPEEPRRMTLAEACDGLTGVQPGLRDARTGAPVDCGGVTLAAAPAPVTAPAPLRLTLADACARQAATGVRLIDSAGGQPIACPTTVAAVPVVSVPAQAAPRTMTRAAACAEQAATGVALHDAATGAPIACPQQTQMAQATAAPTFTTATVAQTVAAQRGDPLSAATLSGTLPAGPVSPVRVGDPLSAETISGVVTQIYEGPPAGYEPVWTDGRINPNRGLPEIQAQVPVAIPVAAQPVAGDRVSTMSVPQPQAVAGGGFVQVGTYGDPANAARAEATLRGLGLPVAVSALTRNGMALQVVAAGPIAAADLEATLRAARAAGYGDAFIR